MAEAMNELAFLVTGVYGKPLPKQMGAPLRLAVPWKYGFKSIKAIVRFRFQKTRPKTYWEASGPSEYGFWANVNPDGRPSALEPGKRTADRHRQARADPALQRLRAPRWPASTRACEAATGSTAEARRTRKKRRSEGARSGVSRLLGGARALGATRARRPRG